MTRFVWCSAASLVLISAALSQQPPVAPAARTASETPKVVLPPPPPSATELAAPPATPAPSPYGLPAVPPAPDWSMNPDSGPWGSTACGPPGRIWVSGEWLYWAMQGGFVPPLVTASPAGTPRATAGALFSPTTAVVFGDRRLNNDWQSGFRLTAGAWFDDCQMAGIGGDFFFLGRTEETITTPRSPTLLFARPFINSLTNTQDTQLVNFPGAVDGSITAIAGTEFIGGGGHFLRNLGCDPCGRLDLTLGYRYLNLRDDLGIAESLTAADGTRFTINEQFRTKNVFHGFPIGVSWERRFSHWFVGVKASVALGWTRTETDISGTTAITAAGATTAQNFAGGLLTQTSNIGSYETHEFAVVPEAGLRLGAQLTERFRGFISYNYLYWSSVGRAGEQVDLHVNPNQIAPPQPGGQPFPVFISNRSDFWVQGVGLGFEYRF